MVGPDPLNACAFRGIPRWRRDGPPPDDDPPRREPEPWTPTERALVYMVGGMGCFIFVVLITIYILAHTPLVAN
jgi:hypothetical protein